FRDGISHTLQVFNRMSVTEHIISHSLFSDLLSEFLTVIWSLTSQEKRGLTKDGQTSFLQL
ncbi:hypothetical protein ACGABA_005436, partial [Escherichia coli]